MHEVSDIMFRCQKRARGAEGTYNITTPTNHAAGTAAQVCGMALTSITARIRVSPALGSFQPPTHTLHITDRPIRIVASATRARGVVTTAAQRIAAHKCSQPQIPFSKVDIDHQNTISMRVTRESDIAFIISMKSGETQELIKLCFTMTERTRRLKST